MLLTVISGRNRPLYLVFPGSRVKSFILLYTLCDKGFGLNHVIQKPSKVSIVIPFILQMSRLRLRGVM